MKTGQLSIKGRALRYLAQREHSRLELERKLARHVTDLPEDQGRAEIAAALDALSAKGLISEARVAESVLNSRAPRLGVHRLKQVLQSKGLDAELIQSTLRQAAGTEFERALQIWQRRFGQAPMDASERGRQMRFLAGRGFSGDVIQRVLKSDADD